MGLIERARELRATIEGLAVNLDNDQALENVELFPAWDGDGHAYEISDRVRYSEKLYKVLQTHTSQPDWSPTNAPSLFAEILPGQDGTDIGDWVQPDSTNPYMAGDRVRYNGMIYESVIDGNIWSPDAYPSGWKVIG